MSQKKNLTLTIIISMIITGCATTKSMTVISEPKYNAVRVANTEISNSSQSNYLGNNQELQCLGDLVSSYETWDINIGEAQNEKYTLTVLPITNHTNNTSDDLPLDMTLTAQRIASQLGIGYNVLFIPSLNNLSSAQNTIYTNYRDLLLKKQPPARVGLHDQFFSNKNITIVSALTEYDDAKKEDADSVNLNGTGTIKSKSFSAGASLKNDKFNGRMSMVFSVAYAAHTGDYILPQMLYHPNATTTVTIDFQDTYNDDEFSFSYNGGKPVIGHKAKFATKDSRFIAIRLLMERGLLEALGKYHKVPYWRCMYENQQPTVTIIDGKKVEKPPIGKIPLPLDDARKVVGYDPEVEKTVRRMFKYRGNAMGLGPYSMRPFMNAKPGYIWTNLADAKDEQLNPNFEGNITYKLLPIDIYNKYDVAQCGSLPIGYNSQLDNPEVQQVLDCRYNLRLDFINSGYINPNARKVIVGSTTATSSSFLEQLKIVAKYSMIGSEYRSEYAKFLTEINKNIGQYSDTPESYKKSEDAFTELWISLPYKKDARIYPYYLVGDSNVQ